MTDSLDKLTRSLANSTSRHQAIAALFAGILSGTVGLIGPHQIMALATCGAVGAYCTQDRDCCLYTCDKTAQKCSCRASKSDVASTMNVALANVLQEFTFSKDAGQPHLIIFSANGNGYSTVL